MARPLRLGITLSDDDAKVFWHNEQNYVVTPQQKARFIKAQKVYESHPIDF